MYTFCVLNNKGGVAKTSTTANVGAYFAYNEKKTLIVDFDPQNNLTQHFGIYNVDRSIADTLREYKTNKQSELPVQQVSDNLFIVPAALVLKDVEKELVSYNNSQNVLKKLLRPFKEHFDYCIIDCYPSLGILSDNAVCASDGIVVPVEATAFSWNGVKNLISYFTQLKEEAEIETELLGAFLAKYDSRNSISQAVKGKVEEFFKDFMLDTVVRTNVSVTNAQANGKDIFQYDATCHAALDYGNLADELMKRIAELQLQEV